MFYVCRTGGGLYKWQSVCNVQRLSEWLIVISLYNYTKLHRRCQYSRQNKISQYWSTGTSQAAGWTLSRQEPGGCNLIANLSKSIAFCILSAGLSEHGRRKYKIKYTQLFVETDQTNPLRLLPIWAAWGFSI